MFFVLGMDVTTQFDHPFNEQSPILHCCVHQGSIASDLKNQIKHIVARLWTIIFFPLFLIKFIYSERATKVDNISDLILLINCIGFFSHLLRPSQNVVIFIIRSNKGENRQLIKEGCNWGHGLSAAIKVGSLEKTVGASLILHSGVYLAVLFRRKNYTTLRNILHLQVIVRFSTKKRLAFYYGAKLIFRSFATFFVVTIFWSCANQRFCFSDCSSVCNQTASIWALGFLAWWQLTNHTFNPNLPYKPFGPSILDSIRYDWRSWL